MLNSSTTRWAGIAVVAVAALVVAAPLAAQDAVAVDPAHYKVEFENDQVRVLRISYGPGEKSVMHSHPAGVAIFMKDLKSRFTMPDGEATDMEVKAGTVAWSEAQSHMPENLGDEPLEVIQVELKKAAADAAAKEMLSGSGPAWAATYNSGDAAALTAMYWEDAVIQPPGVPAAAGADAIRAYFEADIAGAKAAGLTMNIPEAGAVYVSGDLAFDAGSWSATDASGATVDTGNYIGVYQKRDGEWRYIRDTWNSDSSPAGQ